MKFLRARSIALGMALGILPIVANSVAAQDYCVVCAEPQATYRCQVTGAASAGTGQQLSCIKTLAAEGQHATCAVRQPIAGAQCDGPIRQIAAANVPPLVAAPAQSGEAPKRSEPETVEQAMKKVSASAARQMDKTNEQIKRGTEATGSFVQRTFSCITSLFSKCGGN